MNMMLLFVVVVGAVVETAVEAVVVVVVWRRKASRIDILTLLIKTSKHFNKAYKILIR